MTFSSLVLNPCHWHIVRKLTEYDGHRLLLRHELSYKLLMIGIYYGMPQQHENCRWYDWIKECKLIMQSSIARLFQHKLDAWNKLPIQPLDSTAGYP